MSGKVIAVIPAAGSGRRFGAEINKAFVEILGKPLIAWALESFEACGRISEVIPVIGEPDMERARQLFDSSGFEKVRRIAKGGRERQDSVQNALRLVGDRHQRVLIHDAVRPLVDEALIERCIDSLTDCDGVVPGVPLKDTVKEVQDGVTVRTLDRSRLVAVQTPQVFVLGTVLGAYESLSAAGDFLFTDDAAAVEAAGGRIRVVEGNYKNIKITSPEDALIAEAFLRMGHE